jgi:hypothetical protein
MSAQALSDERKAGTYKIQNRHFHHTLVKVGRFVLHHFHRHNFLSFEILTLDDLSKGTLTQDIENKVPIACIN